MSSVLIRFHCTGVALWTDFDGSGLSAFVGFFNCIPPNHWMLVNDVSKISTKNPDLYKLTCHAF